MYVLHYAGRDPCRGFVTYYVSMFLGRTNGVLPEFGSRVRDEDPLDRILYWVTGQEESQGPLVGEVGTGMTRGWVNPVLEKN